MRISVVTISYNQGRFLEAALRSVLDQGFDDLEYLVLDGGSTDGSVETIRRYADRLAFWCSEPDGGPAAALNSGLARATGEVFAFVNSDDLLLPGALHRAAEAFRRHPGADVVYGHGVEIDAAGRVRRPIYSDRWSLWRYVHGRCVLVQPATFLRREAVLRAGGFNEAARTAWDGELWVALAQAGARWVRIPERLAAFRIHDGSITGGQGLQAEFLAAHAALAERVRPGAVGSRLGPPLARLQQAVTDPLLVARRALARARLARG
jgi:glycosyltransferase involved in cell wall biosynthesis